MNPRKTFSGLFWFYSASLWTSAKIYTKIETQDCLSLPPLIFNFPWALIQPPAMRQRHLHYNDCLKTSGSPVKTKNHSWGSLLKARAEQEKRKNPSCRGLESKTTQPKYSPITSQPEETGTYRQVGYTQRSSRGHRLADCAPDVAPVEYINFKNTVAVPINVREKNI